MWSGGAGCQSSLIASVTKSIVNQEGGAKKSYFCSKVRQLRYLR